MSTANNTASRWIDALRLSAEGRSDEASWLVSADLRLSLCRPSGSEAMGAYIGPLPVAVRKFASQLGTEHRRLLNSYEAEFTEVLLDDTLLGIMHTVRLVEHCRCHPSLDFDELVGRFGWWAGLRRSLAWKQEWVACHLRSFLRHGISLPLEVEVALEERGEAKFDYQEVPWAIASRRLQRTWQDFVRDQGVMAQTVTIVEDVSSELAAESFDYRAISMAEVASQVIVDPGIELALDLARMSEVVSRDISLTLSDLHRQYPRDGYPPVAWHNVFWSLQDEYDLLNLEIETREPEIESDRRLLGHLLENYPEVEPLTRPTLNRRRNRLNGLCRDQIFNGLRQIFSIDGEQTRTRITPEGGGTDNE